MLYVEISSMWIRVSTYLTHLLLHLMPDFSRGSEYHPLSRSDLISPTVDSKGDHPLSISITQTLHRVESPRLQRLAAYVRPREWPPGRVWAAIRPITESCV